MVLLSVKTHLLVHTFSVMGICGLSATSTLKSFAGFDLGTSGARLSIIEESEGDDFNEIYSTSITWDDKHPYDDPNSWTHAIETLLEKACVNDKLKNVKALCASGTSASTLILDSKQNGKFTRKPRMYDFDAFSSSDANVRVEVQDLLDKHVPPLHTARASTGCLAKLLSWNAESKLEAGEILSHQSDYCSMFLMFGPTDDKRCGSGLKERKREIVSDWHNALKLGYDVQNLEYPKWLIECLEDAGMEDPLRVLPSRVVMPGEPIGNISQKWAAKYGISENAKIVGGTTDSNAAFFAAIGNAKKADIGTAVVSLGSTLAIKQLSATFCEDATRGVYR